ncbi:MAG TPA: holo-ACP synthase [Bacteroidales bacterium]|nr:holo-ACP synthase [Bacteroidales bacterium]
MIYGIGTDLIETSRVKEQLEKVEGLCEQLFTPSELAYCRSMKHSEQHFAARLAAKEACFKAFGTGWRHGMAYREVEILRDELGKPMIRLHGKCGEYAHTHNIRAIHVSLSHIRHFAMATVVLEC